MKTTQIICIHEGVDNSVDRKFAQAFLKQYKPSWVRPGKNNKGWQFESCGDNTNLLKQFPRYLDLCSRRGGHTTLVVLGDLDHSHKNGDELKEKYWKAANAADIKREYFDQVIFIFPKDRIENWIEYINMGHTNEEIEGPRVSIEEARKAGKALAVRCKSSQALQNIPLSLAWSCNNWQQLVRRMREGEQN